MQKLDNTTLADLSGDSASQIHGTHVVGTVLGKPIIASGSSQNLEEWILYQGVAPDAKLAYASFGFGNEEIEIEWGSEVFDPAYAIGAKVSSNSWTTGASCPNWH